MSLMFAFDGEFMSTFDMEPQSFLPDSVANLQSFRKLAVTLNSDVPFCSVHLKHSLSSKIHLSLPYNPMRPIEQKIQYFSSYFSFSSSDFIASFTICQN